MRLAFVVPRYGAGVLGGAETAARQLAERLVAAGWRSEVFTTCATDAMTWEDALPPGTATEGGVTVHRLASAKGRDPGFHPYSGRLLASPEAATRAEAERWIDLQGPICPDLVEAVASSEADIVAFYPYLYYPTVKGVPRLSHRAVLHAAAHDEAPLRLPVFPEVFASAGGLVFHTHTERALVQRLFGLAERPQIVLGLGVERHAQADPGAVPDRPYLVCIGRVDGPKGADALAKAFLAYKRRRPGSIALVFVGPVVDTPPAHPDIVVTGPVDEPTKWGLIEGATALVSPSALESFSLVVVEAWSAGIPVMVNGRCDPTREHCERSGGGAWFTDYASFEVLLDRILADAPLRRALGEAGRRYVEANFTWPVVIQRYQRFVSQVANRA